MAFGGEGSGLLNLVDAMVRQRTNEHFAKRWILAWKHLSGHDVELGSVVELP